MLETWLRGCRDAPAQILQLITDFEVWVWIFFKAEIKIQDKVGKYYLNMNIKQIIQIKLIHIDL